MYKLIIFDTDGTLTDFRSGAWLPGREAKLRDLLRGDDVPRIALASNQGGVGTRYWMEKDGWGQPEKFPTEEMVIDKLRDVAFMILNLSEHLAFISFYVSFAYQAKNGNWGPTPPDAGDDPHWLHSWRKPAPGMLLQAMSDAGVTSAETLMVGDGDEDRLAAKAAGCHFQSAAEFFGEPDVAFGYQDA